MKLKLSILGTLLLLAAACSSLKKAVVQPVRVEGMAMAPTLNQDDRIFVSRSVDELQRGDIVLFYYPEDPRASYIKRIIGLPGDEIEIFEGKVLLNGKGLEEPYVDPANNQSPRSFRKIKLPNDNFYVMGDNRDNSSDSRIWGLLARHFIYGKFLKKYYAAK